MAATGPSRTRPRRPCSSWSAGSCRLTLDGAEHDLASGSYAFLAPGAAWTLRNTGSGNAAFHWIRKRYEVVEDVEPPTSFVTVETAVEPQPMPDTDGAWATQRFVDPDDVRHDMHVNIVGFQPGGAITFPETHVMEHGLYVLEGKAVYLLNTDWVEVQAGDFMWLRAAPRPATPGGRDRSATCSTRTSTGTRRSGIRARFWSMGGRS